MGPAGQDGEAAASGAGDGRCAAAEGRGAWGGAASYWRACLPRLAASLPALQLSALVAMPPHSRLPAVQQCPAPLPFPTRPSHSVHPPAEWNAERAAVGRYPSHGSDWRTDTRIKDTGDPTAPLYREWTHTEIWDLITLNGRNADPRDVAVWVLNPKAVAGERCWLLLLQGWWRRGVDACWAAAGCELAAAEAAWSRRAAVMLCRLQTCAAGAGMLPCPALRLRMPHVIAPPLRCCCASCWPCMQVQPCAPAPPLPADLHAVPPLLLPTSPPSLADAPAQDSDYQMDPEEYFESQGRLISEEDLQVGALGGGWALPGWLSACCWVGLVPGAGVQAGRRLGCWPGSGQANWCVASGRKLHITGCPRILYPTLAIIHVLHLLPPCLPQAIADSAGGGADADAILLSPDFDDFDPSLVGGFDGGFAAPGGDGGGEDEAF